MSQSQFQSQDDVITLKDTLPVSDYSSLPGKSLLKKTLSLQYPKSSFYVGHTSVHDVRFSTPPPWTILVNVCSTKTRQ